MKIFVLTKRNIITAAICLILAVSVGAVSILGLTKTQETAESERIIPIYNVDCGDKKVVSISFDAAWGNEQTEDLLNILDGKNVKATFFLVGDWVEKYPESVKEIAAAGHDIGNHSSTHPKMTELSRDKMMEEIENCNSLIKNLTGKEVTLFRPPYGDYNNSVVETVNSCGMYCVQWDVDSLDWKDPTAQDMVDRIKSKICPGSIILMHNGATNTPEALPMIIDAVREMGYEFVPISELLLKCDYTTDHKGTMIPAETEEKTESTTAETTKETT